MPDESNRDYILANLMERTFYPDFAFHEVRVIVPVLDSEANDRVEALESPTSSWGERMREEPRYRQVVENFGSVEEFAECLFNYRLERLGTVCGYVLITVFIVAFTLGGGLAFWGTVDAEAGGSGVVHVAGSVIILALVAGPLGLLAGYAAFLAAGHATRVVVAVILARKNRPLTAEAWERFSRAIIS